MGVIVAPTAGALLGAYVLYGIGRAISRERLMGFFDSRPMRLLGFTGNDVQCVVEWFDNKGQLTVLICRCIPGVRSLISIPAGTAKMGLARFSALTALGSAVWNTLLCTMGAMAGSAWQQVSEQVGWVSDVVKYALVVAVFAAALW